MKRSILLALLLSFGLTSFSQQTWWNITDTYVHNKILPDGQKIWIASEGGLICIDNSTGDTTYFTHANSEMPFTKIYDMCLDPEGRLWLASPGGGIASKHGEIWTSYNTTNTDIPNNRAFSIACDSKGTIWANLMHYLVKYDGESWTTYAHDTLGGKISHPTMLAIDKDDRVLFGNGDLRAWDGSNLTRYTIENSPIHDRRISFVKTFPDGKTWIGYQFHGLTITDFTTWEYYDTLVPGIPLEKVYAFDQMSNGDYWLGTYSGKLYHFDGNNWEKINPGSPIDSITQVRYLAVDENDKIYFAAWPNCTFDGENWNKLTTPGSGMRGNSVRNLIHVSDSTTWIANIYGMTGFKNNLISNYRNDDRNIYLSTTSYAEDNFGMVYVAHYYGISKFENNTWVHFYPDTVTESYGINDMCFDGDNNLWYSGGQRLYKYDGNTLTQYSIHKNNFPAREIYCMAVDKNGGIVCGIDKGIAVWNGTKWIAKLNPDASNPDYPRSFDIAVRGDDTWLSSHDGLSKYDGSTWITYNSENSPIPSNYVYQFDFDSKGNIWFMNFSNNLFKFDGLDFKVIPYFESGLIWGQNSNLRIDHLDNIWIGSYDVGISIYNENGISLNLEKIDAPVINQDIIQLAYPNPTNGELKIAYKLPENQSGWMFSITDLQGRKIDGFAISDNENTIHYSTDKLTSGLYLFSIFNSKGEGSTTKIQVIK